MLRRVRSGDTDGRLGPHRWPARPRPATMLRAGLIAALLALAAGVLHAGGPPTSPSASDPATSGLPASGAPDPAAPAGDLAGGPDRRAQLAVPAGSVGVPVRLAEPAALTVVQPGSRVDLLAAPAGGSRPDDPVQVAEDALVLGVVGIDGTTALYLALSPDQARQAVGMPEGTRFGIFVRP